MKHSLLALFIFFAFAVKGQVTYSIWYTSADTVRPGDSAWVDIKYHYSAKSDTCRIYLSSPFTVQPISVFNKAFSDVDKLKKYHHIGMATNDSVTRLLFKIPLPIKDGDYKYIAYLSQVNLHIRNTVGIEEYSVAEALYNIDYFTVLGQHLSEKPKGLYIEVKTFRSGKITTRKLFTESQ